MPFKKLLIANRGEIAIRIARAAGETGLVYPADDVPSPHVRATDAAHEILGRARAPISTSRRVIAAAWATGCDALHPGYGFPQREHGAGARCAEDGIVFVVGPSPEALELFGAWRKGQGAGEELRRADRSDGTSGATTCEQAKKRSSPRSAPVAPS